jgi:phosphoribosylanthranilate isomerase
VGCGKIKICGLFREADIEYANEAKPDYIGFVFAESRRQITPALAERLRRRLGAGIVPVGVFVDGPCEEIAALYRNGVIDIAQLHGHEDGAYAAKLKDLSAGGGRGAVPVIKAIAGGDGAAQAAGQIFAAADFLLLDSGAGSGRTLDWAALHPLLSGAAFARRPWFLAGGIGLHNIAEALRLGPFGIDISSGAERDGIKDREKILRLVEQVHASRQTEIHGV